MAAAVAPTPVPQSPEHINVNAPAFISPAITFNPVTNIVIFTFRDAETGKIREQIPPSSVVSRYVAVAETGIPNPTLPVSTPTKIAFASKPAVSQSQPAPTAAGPAAPRRQPRRRRLPERSPNRRVGLQGALPHLLSRAGCDGA
ncbi:MAG: hypothetical protein WDO24_02140 [Pseudomonadota bacterium]